MRGRKGREGRNEERKERKEERRGRKEGRKEAASIPHRGAAAMQKDVDHHVLALPLHPLERSLLGAFDAGGQPLQQLERLLLVQACFAALPFGHRLELRDVYVQAGPVLLDLDVYLHPRHGAYCRALAGWAPWPA